MTDQTILDTPFWKPQSLRVKLNISYTYSYVIMNNFRFWVIKGNYGIKIDKKKDHLPSLSHLFGTSQV